MGLIQNLKARLTLAMLPRLDGKSSAAGAVIQYLTMANPVWTPRQYDRLAQAGYEQNVVGYRCVNLVSRAVSRVPLLLKKGDKEITSHPILDLLKKPNPYQSGRRLRENWTAFLLLSGNSYIEGVSANDAAPPFELYTHRPDRIAIKTSDLGVPAGFIYNYGGVEKTWLVDPTDGSGQMMQLKFFHPTNDWYGLSPVEAARFPIDLHNQSSEWNKSLLQQGARPSGAMVYKPSGQSGALMPDPVFERVRAQIEEKMSGAQNAGRPLILDGGLEWQQMGMSSVDIEQVEGRRMSAREIAWAFGVPGQMLGIPGDNTYANMEEARVGFYEETVIPVSEDEVDALNVWLVPSFPDLQGAELVIDEDAIKALFPRQKARWEMLTGSRFLTINEKREALKYPRHEDPMADDILIEGSLIPLSEIGVGIEDDANSDGSGLIDETNKLKTDPKNSSVNSPGVGNNLKVTDNADNDEPGSDE